MFRMLADKTILWAGMIKLSHSVFALPFALVATFLAGRELPDRHLPYFGQVLLIVLCMVFARSVAMTFNRIADATLDARNPRTANRAIPAGRISIGLAWFFLIGNAAGFLAACAGFQLGYENPWPLRLGGPVLLVLCSYSYAKRFTRWTHFYLGAAIALSPPAAWVAVSPGTLGWPAFVLAAAVTLWIGGFDVIYACQDIQVDRREFLYSLPARWGPARALLLVRFAHAAAVVLLVTLGLLAGLGWIYYLGVAAVAVLLVVENRMVRPDDFSKVNVAFFTLNGVVSLIFGILTVCDVLLNVPPAFSM